jgi:hypothetical protein
MMAMNIEARRKLRKLEAMRDTLIEQGKRVKVQSAKVRTEIKIMRQQARKGG